VRSGAVSIEAELLEAAGMLELAGVAEARRVASTIWASLEGVSLAQVWLSNSSPLTARQSRQFREAVRRHAAGAPLPYVVGSAGFRTLDLQVDRRVLVPRPETEGLVDRVIAWAGRREAASERGWGTAADIGTGSGCLALSLAAEGRFERVIATDVSSGALAVARGNAAMNGLADRVEFRQGSLLEPLGETRVQVIVSNPPYVTEAEHAKLDRSVREYEPRTALVSGVTGLDHTRALLTGALATLEPAGLLAIEIDATRAGPTLALAERLGWRAAVEQDLFGRPRYLIATKEC
jgi:release factor glutamine methyltransferase